MNESCGARKNSLHRVANGLTIFKKTTLDISGHHQAKLPIYFLLNSVWILALGREPLIIFTKKADGLAARMTAAGQKKFLAQSSERTDNF
jgi:hypothetical protein